VGSVDRKPEVVIMPASDVDRAKKGYARHEWQRDVRSPIVDIRDEPDLSRPRVGPRGPVLVHLLSGLQATRGRVDR
jgi:hypothetical protein